MNNLAVHVVVAPKCCLTQKPMVNSAVFISRSDSLKSKHGPGIIRQHTCRDRKLAVSLSAGFANDNRLKASACNSKLIAITTDVMQICDKP